MIPAHYVDNQRDVNTYHRDGSIESKNEECIGYVSRLAKFIGSNLPRSSFLDVGCRSGAGTRALSSFFPKARVVGVDIVPEFVTLTARKNTAILADMHALPFKTGEFDWIICLGSIEHAYDAAAACKELMRVAAVGVLVSADVAPHVVFEQNPSHYTYINSPLKWLDLMRQPGWELVSMTMPTPLVADFCWLRGPAWRCLNEKRNVTGIESLVESLVGESGYAVELGAADGYYLSNTRNLESGGWEVLCIEPNTENFEKCVQRRKRTVHAACAAEDGANETLQVYKRNGQGNEPVSTLNYIGEKFKETFCSDATLDHEEVVPVKTLNTCLSEAGFPRCDFLSLDVDGRELDVLRGFDAERWQLKVAMVENPFKNPEIDAYFVARGFERHPSQTYDDIWIKY